MPRNLDQFVNGGELRRTFPRTVASSGKGRAGSPLPAAVANQRILISRRRARSDAPYHVNTHERSAET
jgi:hypothetical protein